MDKDRQNLEILFKSDLEVFFKGQIILYLLSNKPTKPYSNPDFSIPAIG